MAKIRNYEKTSVINSIQIDSLKFRIPINLVTILDLELLDNIIELNERTGEITSSEFKRKSVEYKLTETAKVKMLVQKKRVSSQDSSDCLIVYLNSKILKERYFEGINPANIDQVYKDLMSLKAFEVDFDTFLLANCTDIDFKFDEYLHPSEWTELLELIKTETKPKKQMGSGYKIFNPSPRHPLQKGLQFSSRERATKSLPFVKFYYKGGELLSNSKEFYDEHISKYYTKDELLNYHRVETTIKNKDQAKTLGINSTTLSGLLSLTEEQKVNVFKTVLSKHMNRPKLEAIKPIKTNMTPEETVYFNSMTQIMKLTKYPHETVIESLIENMPSAVAKSRKKDKLFQVYNTFVKGLDFEISNNKIMSIFNKFDFA